MISDIQVKKRKKNTIKPYYCPCLRYPEVVEDGWKAVESALEKILKNETNNIWFEEIYRFAI